MNNEVKTIQVPVSITDAAYTEFEKLASEIKEEENSYLRIGVKGGGCSGMSYLLGFDKKEDDDTEYTFNNLRILIKPIHLLYLENMRIDFSQGLDARGFIFENPNATSSCGCGTSFAV